MTSASASRTGTPTRLISPRPRRRGVQLGELLVGEGELHSAQALRRLARAAASRPGPWESLAAACDRHSSVPIMLLISCWQRAPRCQIFFAASDSDCSHYVLWAAPGPELSRVCAYLASWSFPVEFQAAVERPSS